MDPWAFRSHLRGKEIIRAVQNLKFLSMWTLSLSIGTNSIVNRLGQIATSKWAQQRWNKNHFRRQCNTFINRNNSFGIPFESSGTALIRSWVHLLSSLRSLLISLACVYIQRFWSNTYIHLVSGIDGVWAPSFSSIGCFLQNMHKFLAINTKYAIFLSFLMM